MKFTVIVNLTATEKDFFVHRKGCRDISRASRKYGDGRNKYEIDGVDVTEAIKNDVAGYHKNEQGYNFESYQIEPCAMKSKEIAHATH